MITYEQVLQDDLKKAINSYMARSRVPRSQALFTAINYLTKCMSDLIPASPPRLAKRRKLTEESDDDSKEQCADIALANKLRGITRATAPSALKRYRQRTEHDYHLMKVGKSGIIQATSTHEVEVLRYHCFIASEVDRFPYNHEWSGNLSDTSYRIMKTVIYPAKSAQNEQSLLEKLNEHTSKKFKLNTTTFSDGDYCGTPDAIIYENGVITSVAEFKSEKDSFPAAKNQLIVYLVMFKISTGWIVVGPPSKAKFTMVELTDEMKANLQSRFYSYKHFLKALAKENSD